MHKANWRLLAAVGAVFAVTGFLLGGATQASGLFSDVTAAWVQAIGAVAAIWFAGRFSHRDKLNADKQAMDGVHGLIEAARVLAAEAEQAILKEDFGMKSGFLGWYDRVATLQQLMRGVPVLELGSMKVPALLQRTLSHLEVIGRLTKEAGSSESIDARYPDMVRERVTAIETDLALVEQWVEGRAQTARLWMWT